MLRALRPLLAVTAAAAVVTTGFSVGPATPPAAAAAARTPAEALEVPAAAPLRPVAEHRPGTADRYDLAGGCFALYSPQAAAYVTEASDGSLRAAAVSPGDAEPFHLQAFDLGKYLLFGSDEDFLAAEGGPAEQLEEGTEPARERLPANEDSELLRSVDDDLPAVGAPGLPLPDTTTGGVVAAAAPGPLAEWIVRGDRRGFRLHLPADDGAEDDPGPADLDGSAPVRGTLSVSEDGALTVVPGLETDAASTFTFRAVRGCATWPEVEINVEGPVARAGNPVDETAGYLDAHLHMMAFEFIGGRSRCGRPWHPYGAAYALVDCPDHEPGGVGSVLEGVLGGEPIHDTVGWPDFTYWPRYDSLTHEQVYYRWMERAWRGGLRLFTNLLVDNTSLCEVYPLKERSCNEMDGVRLQAQRLRELERYVDAQWGGPGEGWFRIVTSPFEARRTINEGRLAVVMGIEVSVLFDCGIVLGVPQCDEEQIDEQLADVYELGVRQMEFVNKFDNALSGVTGDNHETGIIVNLGNFQDTKQFWQFETCPEDRHEHKHDRPQYNLNDESGATGELLGRDAIFGAVLQVSGTSGAAPLYPEGPHCNVRGLTDLGRHLLDRMVERGMLFDPDHMSTRGRDQALDHLEAQGYGGVVSSHSWADDTVYERVLSMGGVVTPYAGDAEGFLEKWRKTRGWADDRYLFGIGYGADMNGFGGQGAPRNVEPGQGVGYPFTGFGGTTIHRQVSGNQTYDLNTDGVDHYGLYPDWIEDIRVMAELRAAELGVDGDRWLTEMRRGPEAYLQTWERALGIANDACRDDRVDAPTARAVRGLPRGMPYPRVLSALGQPHDRTDGRFTYCLQDGGSAEVRFDADGNVAGVRTSGRAVATARSQRPDEVPGRAVGRPSDHPGQGHGGDGHASEASHEHVTLASSPSPTGGQHAASLVLLAGGAAGLLVTRLRRATR